MLAALVLPASAVSLAHAHTSLHHTAGHFHLLCTYLTGSLHRGNMRLINAKARELKELFGEPPMYAVLSHTWGDEEVPYQDYIGSQCQGIKGNDKINQTCRKAAGHSIP